MSGKSQGILISWLRGNPVHQTADYTYTLRYIDTVFLGRQNHDNQDNQIDAKFEKNLIHYIEFGCFLLNE